MVSEQNLAQNLRHLCAGEKSVSQVCRELQINRQQFGKYLRGTTRPSRHNIRKISRYFGIREQLLDLPHEDFVEEVAPDKDGDPIDPVLDVMRRTVSRARKLVGQYHGHFLTPSHPGKVVRTFIQITERAGLIVSEMTERVRRLETGQPGRTRYHGIIAAQDEVFFLIERDRQFLTGFSETILWPYHRGSTRWLFGQLLAYPWRHGRSYSSPCVWKRLRTAHSVRDGVAGCDAYPFDSRDLDPVVSRYFRDKQALVL